MYFNEAKKVAAERYKSEKPPMFSTIVSSWSDVTSPWLFPYIFSMPADVVMFFAFSFKRKRWVWIDVEIEMPVNLGSGVLIQLLQLAAMSPQLVKPKPWIWIVLKGIRNTDPISVCQDCLRFEVLSPPIPVCSKEHCFPHTLSSIPMWSKFYQDLDRC